MLYTDRANLPAQGAQKMIAVEMARSEQRVGLVHHILQLADPRGRHRGLLRPVGESRELRVPASALVVRGQLEIVFVVKDGKAQLRLVRTGKRQGDQIGLLSGLSDGETVVVEGAAGLRDGQPLEVK